MVAISSKLGNIMATGQAIILLLKDHHLDQSQGTSENFQLHPHSNQWE
jgi:hypothetical protein